MFILALFVITKDMKGINYSELMKDRVDAGDCIPYKLHSSPRTDCAVLEV